MAARRAEAGGGSSADREKGRREDVVGGWLLDSLYIAYIYTENTVQEGAMGAQTSRPTDSQQQQQSQQKEKPEGARETVSRWKRPVIVAFHSSSQSAIISALTTAPPVHTIIDWKGHRGVYPVLILLSSRWWLIIRVLVVVCY